ncbi:MAG TPA: hypothetical protein PKJ62_02945 [Bacteroidia bacterium]|nr:hypothetical protein [Bacteroidia bacterium]HNS13052.1 hypothetical protein [Bacteroidia bacterium]
MKKSSGLLSLTLIFSFILAFYSCKKEAGEGGTSTITGKITVYNFDNNNFNCCPDTFPAVDHDVFVIYGADGNIYDNDVKTSFDGTYEFKYLQKGKYKIFAYSEDSTGSANGTAGSTFRPDVPIFVEVEVTGKNQTVVANEIIVLTTKN